MHSTALDDNDAAASSAVTRLENLGYSKLLVGEHRRRHRARFTSVAADTSAIRSSAPRRTSTSATAISIKGISRRARFYGEAGLEVADEPRQIRNAHYLLGEAAYKSGDIDAARASLR